MTFTPYSRDNFAPMQERIFCLEVLVLGSFMLLWGLSCIGGLARS